MPTGRISQRALHQRIPFPRATNLEPGGRAKRRRRFGWFTERINPKRRRRFALPAHSKFVRVSGRLKIAQAFKPGLTMNIRMKAHLSGRQILAFE